MLRRSFQQPAKLSVTLTLIFRSLSITESQFTKHGGVRPSYGGKGDGGFSYFGIYEISGSHLTETEKCRKVNLIRQSHLKNLSASENGFLLFLWWCPFKIQKEKRAGLQFTSTDNLSLLLTPIRIRWTIPLKYCKSWTCDEKKGRKLQLLCQNQRSRRDLLTKNWGKKCPNTSH